MRKRIIHRNSLKKRRKNRRKNRRKSRRKKHGSGKNEESMKRALERRLTAPERRKWRKLYNDEKRKRISCEAREEARLLLNQWRQGKKWKKREQKGGTKWGPRQDRPAGGWDASYFNVGEKMAFSRSLGTIVGEVKKTFEHSNTGDRVFWVQITDNNNDVIDINTNNLYSVWYEKLSKPPKSATKKAGGKRTRKKRGGGWETVSDYDNNIQNVLEILNKLKGEHVKISGPFCHCRCRRYHRCSHYGEDEWKRVGEPLDGGSSREQRQQDPVEGIYSHLEYPIGWMLSTKPAAGRCIWVWFMSGWKQFELPVKIEVFRQKKPPKSAMKKTGGKRRKTCVKPKGG